MLRTMLKVLLLALFLPAFSWAAGLGELKVISALGQPLRAEIDLVSMKSGEMQSLQAHIAPLDAFKQAGVEYNPLLAHVDIRMAAHPDGSPYILLSSPEIVNDPFLDVLVDLSWPTGQIEREYTMLFDPVEFAKSPAVSPPVALKAKPAAVPAMAAAVVPEAVSKHEYGPVKNGETLSAIAMATKPEGVTLEQMLVALYQANEDAFIGKNMNLLETGRVLRVPAKIEIDSISRNHADKVVRLQAIDWNAYRQRLASSAVERGSGLRRSVSGKITASVEEGRVSPQPKEVLKLSKGQASSATAKEEEKAARVRELNDASERILMLEKNIQEMKKLLALKNQALAGAGVKASAPVAIAGAAAGVSSSLFDNPVLLGTIGGVVLGLAGVAILLSRRKKKAEVAETPRPYMETAERQKPAVKAVGLEREPTAEEPDPLEEAQLYFSYRRYAQAEEILKEVLRADPANFDASLLLMKVHAAEDEKDKLELAARRLQAAEPPGGIWEMALAIGFAADPKNPLYGGAVKTEETEPAVIDLAEPAKESLDFDLDFDSSQAGVDLHLDHAEESAVDFDVLTEEKIVEPSVDFDLSPRTEAQEAAPLEEEKEAVDFDLSSMLEEEIQEAAPLEEEKAVDFDLSSMVEEEAQEAAPLEEEKAVDFDLSAMVEEEAQETAPLEEEKAVDFDLSSMVEEEIQEAAPLEEEKAVDFDLSSMIEEMPQVEMSAEEEIPVEALPEVGQTDKALPPIMAAPETEAPSEAAAADSKTPFDLSDIPSLVESGSKPKRQEIPDVDLHLGETPVDASEPKDAAWYEVATKLDLAKVYQEMGDYEGAREILDEVTHEGDSDQKAMARAMLDSLSKS